MNERKLYHSLGRNTHGVFTFIGSHPHAVLRRGCFSSSRSFGEEAIFMVVALGIFWCIDKKTGYLLLYVSFLGNIINTFLKLLFLVPRPWVLEKDFTIDARAARAEATGYSFPSGHTQNSAVDVSRALARSPKGDLGSNRLRCADAACRVFADVSWRAYTGGRTGLPRHRAVAGRGCVSDPPPRMGSAEVVPALDRCPARARRCVDPLYRACADAGKRDCAILVGLQ